MPNYLLSLSYDGTRYRGWQNQKNTENTIQNKLESLLSKLIHEPIALNASGRTDAGVHARFQTANFHCAKEIDLDKLTSELRHQLPQDIGLLDIRAVPDSFHARLSCKGKTYRYFIWNSEEPCIFNRKYRYILPESLDTEAMDQALRMILGTHDFSAFTSSRNKKHSTVRTVRSARIILDGAERIIEFNADGFLYNMVRILTGTLIEIGIGKRAPESIVTALQSGKRSDAGFTAPPQGLFLWQTEYE